MKNFFSKLKPLTIASVIIVCTFFLSFVATSGTARSLFVAGERFELSEGRTITRTDEGFFPARLVVRQGDTVHFDNATTHEFWPASDSHPNHTIYPAFDPRAPIAPGGSWEFTFTNPGMWQYHDHLASDKTGEIIVLDYRGAVVKTACTSANRESASCFEADVKDVLKERGLEAALNEMARLYEKVPGFKDSCHSVSHTLGEEAYRIYEKDGTLELTGKTSYCGFGFYHGFMEAMLQSTGDVGKARDFCAHAQEILGNETQNAEGACFHGIGHGAVDGADPRDWEDPKKLIEPGLALCERVDPTEPHFFRCASGAFNSLALMYISNTYGLRLDTADLYGICERWSEDRIRIPCYYEMNIPVFRQSGRDLQKAIQTIERIDDVPHAAMAMQSLAGVVGAQLVSASPDAFVSAVAACHNARRDLVVPCLSGIPGGMYEGGVPGEEYKKAFEFCSTSSLTHDEHVACMRAAFATEKAFYSADKHAAICSRVESDLKAMCIDPSK